jgi:hypothetical protein
MKRLVVAPTSRFFFNLLVWEKDPEKPCPEGGQDISGVPRLRPAWGVAHAFLDP